MNPTELLRTAARTARQQLVASLLTLVVVGLMCATALATAGRATATDAALRASLDKAGARALSITDVKDLGVINSATCTVARGLSTVERAVALGRAYDMTLGATPGGNAVPVRPVNDPAAVATLTAGRWPGPNEVVLGPEAVAALRLRGPVGYLESKGGDEVAVVGFFAPRPGFEDLTGLALRGWRAPGKLTELRVIVTDIAVLRDTQAEILGSFGTVDPQALSVTSPTGLATANQLVATELGAANRAALGLILAVGALFIGIVVLADVLLHRRELGRRRALGARRSDLTALYVVRTCLPGALGAGLGALSTWAYFASRGTDIPLPFVGAVAVLAVATVAVASLVPAAWAAHRDPVAVLRTP